MKVIIAGSREIYDMGLLNRTVKASQYLITEVVCGMARGVDGLGWQWATYLNIPIKEFPADWDTYGESAGYKRNVQMAEYADALIAITNGRSRGTAHMIDIATERGLKVFVHTVRRNIFE
jgi:YspA, cpYpsA-related SLOG family